MSNLNVAKIPANKPGIKTKLHSPKTTMWIHSEPEISEFRRIIAIKVILQMRANISTSNQLCAGIFPTEVTQDSLSAEPLSW